MTLGFYWLFEIHRSKLYNKKNPNFEAIKSFGRGVNCWEGTVLPANSDSDVMFCLQSYKGLRIDG